MGGLALFLLVFALIPRRAGWPGQVAAFDAARPAAVARASARDLLDGQESQVSKRIGTALAAFCAEQGWEFPSLRANLSLIGKSFENYLATKVLLGLFGFLIGPLLLLAIAAAGIHVLVRHPASGPAWCWPALFFFLPDLEVRQKADARRRDFRHAIGAFLDLVSMNLAGGRGVPEALMAASEIGSGWALGRIRDALTNARITGQTPWQALGALGDEVRVDELRDLAAALSLVADDGAKVRESLSRPGGQPAPAASWPTWRARPGERSQSMLVAQMLLCAGFLIFLTFPGDGSPPGHIRPCSSARQKPES